MQLKGLVRFFTILLIIYSLYQLSFTWFVRNHEKKLEAKARKELNAKFPDAIKIKNLDQLPDSLKKFYDARLRHFEDSTKDKTLTYGINGKMSYQRAKSEELNLGLDLQGGMSVTLEVEMTGLLKSLANNSKDPNFQKALVNADNRKANSDADFITLFIEEYRKLEPTRPLATLFAAASAGKIDIKSGDDAVKKYIRSQASEAFETTFDRLTKRIDQFGVAQPNINKNPEKEIINIDLPGVKDKERVRANLQSTADLEFWELYTAGDANYAEAWNKTFEAFNKKYGGVVDSTKKADSTVKPDSTAPKQVNDSGTAQNLDNDTTTAQAQTVPAGEKVTLDKFLEPSGFASYGKSKRSKDLFPAAVGTVALKDTSRMNAILNEYRSFFPGDAVFAYGTPEKSVTGKGGNRLALYALKTKGLSAPKLDGGVITESFGRYDQYNKVEIVMEMNRAGKDLWGKMTTENLDRPVAVVLDGIVQTAPNVNDAIMDGTSVISGSYTIEQAKDLAKILKIGKLPAPAKIVQETEVGPTLGQKAIRGGTTAFLISFIVIFLLMLLYYNTSGWVANIALILNLLFTVGVLSGLGASLTAPGIAGLVLTIGMAVDTNVIIYERIKEELTKGKGYIAAINEGYKRSLPPVLDAHITTLLTAIILFYFGLGPVKGFATTQILGILLSLFCGILVSRWITEWFTNKKKHLIYFTSVSRKIFRHASFKFIEYRKVAYIISVFVMIGGVASLFNGFDEGVEFKGGRSYRIAFEKPVDNIDNVRDDLREAFEGENPVVKTVGGNSTLDITTSYQINNTSKTADSTVQHTLMNGLKNYLPQGITYADFNTKYKQSSDKVLPTISDDLRKGAVKATVFALIVIFLYIFIRFRDWRYSMGTIFSLLHDVFVTLIVFSFAKAIVPFPLEIDQHFIAAILTVIGFSMNDTVIVYDRIREDRRLYPNAPLAETINRAINETLSRTIMTSLTVFLTILILFIFGGEVTRGFSFAMLIGVITGSYSSIFVAAPILVDLSGKKGLGDKKSKEKKS
ncbi:MAG TPA: protein translocase subunit SecDF [Chitinophagaceae bacterium]|jgi:SecD/SecF fusion protein|nr:protein translocase subunit SecDF [Chitinophagaceae bacterium]